LYGVQRQGVTVEEILARSDRFMEVADRFGMLASGSSGLQGEWPKVSMTQANDGLYYPDSFVTDDEAVRHVIVKLVRSNEPVDRLILEGEAFYSRIAQEIGLHVSEPSTYAEGVLIIPRFDRQKRHGGGTVRVDDVTRECLAAIPDTSIPGRRVARELTTLIERRGKPGMIVSDNVLRAEGYGAASQSLTVRQHALAA
jgi:hypothetical protein